MRSDPAQFELSTAVTLPAVLQQLADEPGRHTLMAGGTELMVAFNTGRLRARSLISIQHLPELCFVRIDEHAIHIGAGTTFTDLRRNATIARELPLLERAASWTGSIANQNRGTIGGNVCNASPAADTPPVLLVYDAELTLLSAAGERRLPYREFHLGYKQTALRGDELLYRITVPRAFAGWRQYLRKVGTRNAQAISKTALAGLARLEGDAIAELRLGAASVADRPVRMYGTEAALQGAEVAPAGIDASVRRGRAALAAEVRPIDDIRSTARYRAHVAGNLLEEFLRELAP